MTETEKIESLQLTPSQKLAFDQLEKNFNEVTRKNSKRFLAIMMYALLTQKQRLQLLELRS